MTSFTDRFGGITIYPSDIGYKAYSLTSSTSLTWPELGDTSSNLAASFIRASSTVTGAGFIMPDARDVSVGRAERIKNIGAISIPPVPPVHVLTTPTAVVVSWKPSDPVK